MQAPLFHPMNCLFKYVQTKFKYQGVKIYVIMYVLNNKANLLKHICMIQESNFGQYFQPEAPKGLACF